MDTANYNTSLRILAKNSVQDMGSAAEIESLVEDLVGEERTVIV